jgi:carbonic anhydrase/acetyltransferase-like protein (isoleucine patch superfamily)
MGYIAAGITAHPTAYVHESAHLYGRVVLAENASIWINAVIRAEMHEVHIGENSNIQDFVMIHVANHVGTYVGKNCSITHHCILHGCRIEDNCLIGINSTIADGCVVGENSIVGAHTYLAEGTIIPPNSIVIGAPGRVSRSQNNSVANIVNAHAYVRNAQAYRDANFRVWEDPKFQAEIAALMKR